MEKCSSRRVFSKASDATEPVPGRSRSSRSSPSPSLHAVGSAAPGCGPCHGDMLPPSGAGFGRSGSEKDASGRPAAAGGGAGAAGKAAAAAAASAAMGEE